MGVPIEMYSYRIVCDEAPTNPRLDNNLSKMILCRRHHCEVNETDISTELAYSSKLTRNMIYELMEDSDPVAIIYPVFAYIHSGIVLSIYPFNMPFDNGLLGFAIVTRRALMEIMGSQIIDDRVFKTVESEIEMLSKYWGGNVLEYQVVDRAGDVIEYGHDFYDAAHCERSAIEATNQMNVALETLIANRLALACAV